MKIKTQFSVLISLISAVPLLCLLAVLLTNYFNSPKRLVTREFSRISEEFDIDQSELDGLRQRLERLPPNVEMVIISRKGSTVVYSSMKEIRTGTSDREFFDHMKRTGREYFYQMSGPRGRRADGDLLLVSRSAYDDTPRRRAQKVEAAAFAVLFSFVVLFIASVLVIGRNIFRSITALEERTQKIADGDLSAEIPRPSPRDSNEIIALAGHLEKMRLSLIENSERKAKFIMGLSHDLRTPVALIRGYAEGLIEGVIPPEKAQDSLGLISAKAGQLETLVNELINFVRLDTGEWRRRLEPRPLLPLLEDFAEGMGAAKDVFRRDVRSSIDVPPEVQVPMDPLMVSRALENLYGNALRYTKEGDSIEFGARMADGAVEVYMEDSGCGIKSEDLDRIFSLFYRGTNSRREEGFGIGLSVVKNIVDSHGWSIRVESREGEGSRFSITIPLGSPA